MARWLLESSTRQRNSKQIVLCEKRHVQAQEEVTARRLTATSTRKKPHGDGTLLSVRANRAAVCHGPCASPASPVWPQVLVVFLSLGVFNKVLLNRATSVCT